MAKDGHDLSHAVADTEIDRMGLDDGTAISGPYMIDCLPSFWIFCDFLKSVEHGTKVGIGLSLSVMFETPSIHILKIGFRSL